MSGQMKHLNIYLKHTCITITTRATSRSTFATSIYNTCNIPLKHLNHLKHTVATCGFHPSSSVRRNTERGSNRFQQAGDEGWWRSLAAASCTCACPGPEHRRPPLLPAWPHAAAGACVVAAGEHGQAGLRGRKR
jgi:hypothetical protein